MIIEKTNNFENTCIEALDLIIEYYTNRKEIGIGTNKWLREVRKGFGPDGFTKAGVRRMFFHIQRDLSLKQFDINENNKKEYLKEFIKEWRSKHNVNKKLKDKDF